MARIQARWLAMAASALLAAGAPAQAPPAVPADPSRGVDVSAQAPDPTQALRAEALTLFGRLDDDRASVWVASGGGPDARRIVSCPNLFARIEVWTYLAHRLLGTNTRMLFFPEPGTGISRYWTVIDGESVLFGPKTQADKPLDALAESAFGCADTGLVQAAYRAISSRQQDTAGGLRERAALAVPLSGPTVSSPSAAPAPLVLSAKKLSGKERKQAIEALPDRYRQFLSDVEPILTDVEEATFLRLGSDYQRDKFVEDFWKRRSVDADGQRVAFKDIYELRLQLVKERFRHINTDQGRIFLINGPPDGFRRIDCQDIYNPIEIWYYERLETLRMSKISLLFYQPFGTGDFRLWTPLEGPQALLVGGVAGLSGIGPGRTVDVTRCSEWREINGAMATAAGVFGTMTAQKMIDELKTGPKPDVEGVDKILLMTTDVDPAAAKLPVQRVLRFPEMVASKIRMELSVLLERETLGTKALGEETFYDLDVIGEIVKGGKLVDNFRYRFDFPASTVKGAFLPLNIERYLYPGEYRLKVKIADSNRNGAALIDEKVVVPESPDQSLSPEEKAAREAAKAALARLVASPNERGALTLLPIAREFATGVVRFETRASSDDIASAEFFLDGRKVITDRRPPFEADLDLGALPRKRIVKVAGFSKDGRMLSEDELVLNEGREAFRVKITAPEKGISVFGPVRVVADLAIPETKRLQKLEIYVNETRAAILYQPPFQQIVDVPRQEEIGFLRVVATLEDGDVTEDIRYINAPKYLSEVDVQAVELYTSVFDKGRPVTGLARTNFRVLEDGVEQSIDGFEVVTNLPLSLGIGVDTSGSMEETLAEAQKAANDFLASIMTPRDRAFLVTFDNEPQLVSRFTTDRDRLAQALAGLRAQGSTSLWDAVVYGLYQYQGTKGRKAYVILSDGADRASKFTFEASLDYARKTGVAIYFIGLKIGGTQFDVRTKLNRMARETGGAVYYVDSAKGLAGVYKEIDEELRSQYFLTYTPPVRKGSAWRKVEVKMTPTNLDARTISGYYP
ncbi:MAG: VWA domain-containing protein [Holophagales bacterium]|nr:VWA domain-containing protein [Holophagales bacterium]